MANSIRSKRLVPTSATFRPTSATFRPTSATFRPTSATFRPKFLHNYTTLTM